MADDSTKNGTKATTKPAEKEQPAKAARVEVPRTAERETKTSKQSDPPPSGSGANAGDEVEVFINNNERMGDLSEADASGLTDPNQFSSSADPVAEVYVPKTTVTETSAGVEIRPEKEPPVVKVVNKREPGDPVAAIYGVHSGKVGHSVPIVDDYTPVNPRSGGLIGGDGGPGAVGRVKAEQDKERAAKNLMDALVDGTSAARRKQEFEAQVANEGKTKYRVVGGAIFTESGKVVPGQEAYLTEEQAKRFTEMGRIAPWFD